MLQIPPLARSERKKGRQFAGHCAWDSQADTESNELRAVLLSLLP